MVIAGFGDTGLLTAIQLSNRYDVLGVSPKPLLSSGQELGLRLTRPQEWKRDYLVRFDRYKKLDGVRTVHGEITRIDAPRNRVELRHADGTAAEAPYDALVIASGVTNGFWRTAEVQGEDEIEKDLAERAQRIRQAETIAIIGGGATAVSVAANVAGVGSPADASERRPGVHLFHPRDEILPGYHPRVRRHLDATLRARGVELYPRHRAILPSGLRNEAFTRGPLAWSTGQPAFEADLAIWATGSRQPNNAFIPQAMLDEAGYVRVDHELRVPGTENVFAIGDIAATDPNRSSARNWGYRIAAHNVHALLAKQGAGMKPYTPPTHRWGSILGPQANGLEVFQPNGGRFRFPRWAVEHLLFPLAVRRGIYRGMRGG